MKKLMWIPHAPLINMKKSALVAVILFGVSIFGNTAYAVAPANVFSAAISPMTAQAGTVQTYVVTITNSNLSDDDIKSVIITKPTGWSNPSSIALGGNATAGWTAAYSIANSQIEISKSGGSGNNVQHGNSFTITFTATSPNTVGIGVFAVRAFKNNSYQNGHGGEFSQSGNEPQVVVSMPPKTLSVSVVGSGSISSAPVGIDCGANCAHAFDYGTLVTLTATPAAFSTFSGWTGDCIGTSCVVTMSANHSATATFLQNVENSQALCSDGIDNDGDQLADLADPDCAAFKPVTPTANIVATKIVCDSETDLPNWGLGGHAPIAANTATDYVAAHPSCHLASGWSFQLGSMSLENPGDTLVGEAGNGWTTFGPTNELGFAVTTLPVSGQSIWGREVLQNGYVPFTFGQYPDNSNAVSAEFYCGNDAVNYDNLDEIGPMQSGATYYCVAFNAPVTSTPICSESEHLVDGQCVPNVTPPTCDIGYVPQGDTCVPVVTECSNGQVIVNNQCVDPAPVTPQGGSTGGSTGSADSPYWGCTNASASNFNSLANRDDGSCVLPQGSTSGVAGGNGTTTGEVLGVSTTTPELALPAGCSEYIHSYMGKGKKNDKEDVVRLQIFLNETMGTNIPTSGFFGAMTKNLVKKFQVKYHAEIIKPWVDAGYKGKDIENGTGYVYKTTKREINLIKCSTLDLPVPDLTPDISN